MTDLHDIVIADREAAITFLETDGDLLVPCSRYGRCTSDCAPWAWAAASIVADACGEYVTAADLDYAMGLVVNDHDDVESLIVEHGAALGFTIDADGDLVEVES
jgi:hypothetical protein